MVVLQIPYKYILYVYKWWLVLVLGEKSILLYIYHIPMLILYEISWVSWTY